MFAVLMLLFTASVLSQPQIGISITKDTEHRTYIWRSSASGVEAVLLDPEGFIIVNRIEYDLSREHWVNAHTKEENDNAKMSQLINAQMSGKSIEWLEENWDEVKLQVLSVFDKVGHLEEWHKVHEKVMTYKLFSYILGHVSFKAPAPVLQYGFPGTFPHPVNGDEVISLYHATGKGAKSFIEEFTKNGKQTMKWGRSGKFGPGLYFAKSIEGARAKSQAGFHYIIVANVLVGRQLTFNSLPAAQAAQKKYQTSHGMPEISGGKGWPSFISQQRYDSVHLRLTQTHGRGHAAEGEYVVYWPDQVIITSIWEDVLDTEPAHKPIEEAYKYVVIESRFNQPAAPMTYPKMSTAHLSDFDILTDSLDSGKHVVNYDNNNYFTDLILIGTSAITLLVILCLLCLLWCVFCIIYMVIGYFIVKFGRFKSIANDFSFNQDDRETV